MAERLGASNRVVNGLRRAEMAGELPVQSLSEWKRLEPHEAISLFQRMEGFGLKSALELNQMLTEYLADQDEEDGERREEEPGITSGDEEPNSAGSSVADVEILKLLQHTGASARLENALRATSMHPGLPVSTVYEWRDLGSRRASCLFRRIPNLGSKSINELVDLIEGYLAGNTPFLYVPLTTEQDDSRPAWSEILSMAQLGDVIFSNTDSREARILENRFKDNQTLEEIGQKEGVTRERIRQIEKKALRKIRHPLKNRNINKFFDQNRDSIWSSLSDKSYLSRGEVRSFYPKLDYRIAIAIDAVYGSINEFLGHFAFEVDGVWVKEQIDQKKVDSAKSLLESLPKNRRLPVPVALIEQDLEKNKRELEIALEKTNRVSLYRNVLLRGPATKRKRRTVDLWHIFNYYFNGGPARIIEVWEKYVTHVKDDICSPRDLLIVMSESDHIFQKMGNFGWSAVTREVPIPPEELVMAAPSLSVLPAAREKMIGQSGSLRNILISLLRRQGPLPYRKIQKAAKNELKDRYSPGSVAGILGSNPEFEFFAPGIIGLYENKNEETIVDQVKGYLLRISQVKPYILDKVGGYPDMQYPAWGADAEVLWARWLRDEGRNDYLYSLLNVSETKEWRVSESERNYWESLKRQYGSIQCLPDVADSSPAEFDGGDIIKFAKFCWLFKGANWISANRILGQRIDSVHCGPYMVGLMCQLGVLKAENQWYTSHTLGERSYPIMLQLLEAWDSSIFPEEAVLRICRDALMAAPSQGWVTGSFAVNLEGALDIESNGIRDREDNYETDLDELMLESVINDL
ncbi:hypothetical protein LL252_00770 [Alcanivorax marinus]|uniref:RNA polymerase sigma-70 domain-containing protein n=1 Tax=Alloalcanivorax marinus TaxID=1177169 RepID=A0A9Q3UJN7_9GAMM|nr:sigma factor-like helix-turn-helix DNA-binding protein [Alloalcanivorax marinus]MCC4307088.1 hypothetical protein [Alloalcanivorax marinus]